ncbi:hypothetical protein [Chryseobacterium sp. AG844]|uniref:hypothetical protein n=1 Tax=Chryseobacterium sp. AG844 TaxID=2183998 RepID=UPI000D7125BF|nr:hypothetical protein [Chryseobacterium sp. AG844]PWW25971.1 hypothetical protein DEU40_11057 [Chryseobacterium sp. AG844]
MKNFKYFAVALIISSIGGTASAQIKGNQTFADGSIPASSAFLDASLTASVNNASLGKGLIFPRADITQLALANQGTLYNAGNNPNRFDGMIVYNTATTGSPATGTLSEPLFAGFWYYDNKTASPTTGTWRPVTGAGGKENILQTETVTTRSVESKQVFAKKGTFTASGSSTAPTSYTPGPIIIPASSTASVYKVTIYKAGTGSVYDNNVYSYDIATGNLITGSPSMSVVYPAGNYDYIVEYIK